MQEQNFRNHIKKHSLFHYFLIPVTLLLVLLAAINLVFSFDLTAIINLVMAVALHLVVFITRDYAKKNQDRVIRAEMRLRYFILSGESFERTEEQLSFSQLAALRFAQDDQLLQLLNDSNTIHLSADEIKKQIINWKPDYMRV